MLKIIVTSTLFILISSIGFSQNMTNEKLEEIFTKKVDTLSGYPGYWEMIHKKRQLLCITDVDHNRMRIISPVCKICYFQRFTLVCIYSPLKRTVRGRGRKCYRSSSKCRQ